MTKGPAKSGYMVIAGDYLNCRITTIGKYGNKQNMFCIELVPTDIAVWRGFVKYKKETDFVEINKSTVESWELVEEQGSKSLSSSLVRGLVGGALLGPLGLIAGGVTGKTNRNYTVAVLFKNGKKSLLDLGEFHYKEFLKIMF